MHVSIRQRKTAHMMRIVGREDERDTDTTIVAHQVDLIDAQGVQKLREHRHLRVERNIPRRLDLARAVSEKSHGNTAAPGVTM